MTKRKLLTLLSEIQKVVLTMPDEDGDGDTKRFTRIRKPNFKALAPIEEIPSAPAIIEVTEALSAEYGKSRAVQSTDILLKLGVSVTDGHSPQRKAVLKHVLRSSGYEYKTIRIKTADGHTTRKGWVKKSLRLNWI